MRKIALLTLLSLPLLAGFFPSSIESSITAVDGKNITLSQPLQTGMSGIVIHSYGADIQAVTARVVQTNAKQTKLLADDIIKHDKLPTIKTQTSVGDKVIGGYLYNNILLLAPDAQTYAAITSQSDKNWIHPDLYALFLESYGDNIPTKKNLKAFAKAYQVGLIYIVANGKAKLLDPLSGKVLNTRAMQDLPAKGNKPFYMRFSEINAGLFSLKNTKSYYSIMESL